ncbi:MAG: HAMP domain-containing protein [Gammaproteobacteria bacterium]|nr:HAMP domain-containing protein [Gammaproteobacteria bacterium]
MRLLPGSLFGRLVLILISGLILAQIIGALIFMKDRDDHLRRGFGLNLVQKITAIVVLVEESTPDRRQRILDAFNSPAFRVYIAPEPASPTEGSVPVDYLAMLLHQQLPEHRQYQITVTPAFQRPLHRHGPSANLDAPMPFRSWRGIQGMGPLVGFQANIQLFDGSWIIFQNTLPEDIRAWPIRVLAYLGVLLISILLISLFTVRVVTRPLDRLAKAAERLGTDIKSPPLPETGPTEVRQAAAAFNRMQTRLRRFIEDRGEILAAVSHDLKTPITRMRLRTALLDEGELKERLENDLREMEQMVQASLDFMRGTESSEQTVPVDMRALLESLQDDVQELGNDMEIEPTSEIAPFPGKPLALKRCIGNLVENGVRYGRRVRVRLTESTGIVTVTIADEGPGIPEGELETLFRPFQRREGSRSKATGGTGLGLGIARNIARGHGGDVTLRNGIGGGLEAVVTLPRSP